MIFDPVAGKGVEALAQAAAHNGILIEYGALSGADAITPFPLFCALSKALTIRGYTLFEIVADPVCRAKAEKYVVDGLSTGQLKPIIDRTFALAQIADAHRYMESNQQFGKIVVVV